MYVRKQLAYTMDMDTEVDRGSKKRTTTTGGRGSLCNVGTVDAKVWLECRSGEEKEDA